jgi:hypothetical protein
MSSQTTKPRWCEALVLVRGHYTPCYNTPAEKHHRLTRARGGLILDEAGETYHHMWLCRVHHEHAHNDSHSMIGGLLLAGFVLTVDDKPAYFGPDEYLKSKYPPRPLLKVMS